MYGGVSEKCIRCTKAVYFTERIVGPGQKVYHKSCFTCKSCNKTLTSTNLTENKTEIYCKNCYGRLFGPKGYGFGAALSTDSEVSTKFGVVDAPPTVDTITVETEEVVKPTKVEFQLPDFSKFEGKNTCPTCEKTVYFAEQLVGPGGLKYHKICFKCVDCKKTLAAGAQINKGVIPFCKQCHTKNYGQKGYGFGGAVTA